MTIPRDRKGTAHMSMLDPQALSDGPVRIGHQATAKDDDAVPDADPAPARLSRSGRQDLDLRPAGPQPDHGPRATSGLAL